MINNENETISINDILKKSLILGKLIKENTLFNFKGSEEIKLLDFDFTEVEMSKNELMSEFISFIYYTHVSESKSAKDAKELLSTYVININDRKILKHYTSYANLSTNKADKEITYYEYYIFEQFRYFTLDSLVEILKYLIYNNTINIDEYSW